MRYTVQYNDEITSFFLILLQRKCITMFSSGKCREIFSFILCCLAIHSFSEIRHGNMELRYNDKVVFKNDSIQKDTFIIGANWCPPNDYDLIIGDAGLCCSEVSCCCGMDIASPYLIVLSKKSFDSYAFSSSINFDDSISYIKGTTDTFFSSSCYNYFGFIEPSRMHNPDTTKYLQGFIVFKTQRSTYILIVINRFLHRGKDTTEPYANDCINGISFNWYEQTDGTTDFSGIRSIGIGPARRAFAPGRIPASPSRAFGIDGRMSRAPARGVVIERGAWGARFCVTVR